MERIAHGSTSAIEKSEETLATDPSIDVSRFGYLFPDLATDPAALLPISESTMDNLARLGATMLDRGSISEFDSNIHAGYTYLGQFIDHDIVFTHVPKTPRDLTDSCMLGDSHLVPWDLAYIDANVRNQRTAILELESIYGGKPLAPRDPSDPRLMMIGKVSTDGAALKGEDHFNDLPLLPRALNEGHRVPWIGDKRNDQTLILSQLHVAFLRAHNSIVRKRNCSFEEARLLLRQHYLWLIVHDFLKKRIANPDIVEEVINSTKPRYPPTDTEFFLPLEFTVAAFRFGHSMIRSTYYLNDNLPIENLRNLFTLAALRKNGGGSFTSIPESKVISWKEFLPGGENVARRLDTRMVEPLLAVLDEKEQIVPCETRLAVQDLRRGYMMRIPTGQAIALKLGAKRLEEEDLLEASATELQFEVLKDSGFVDRTPLWFYVLAEASLEGGNRLGPIGSYLVAEVIVGLVRRLDYSFLNQKDWSPNLGLSPGEFTLSDLLRLAGVLED